MIQPLELAFNPNDTFYVSVLGPKIFKFYRLSESSEDNKTPVMKLINSTINGVPSELNNNYSSHCWLTIEPKIVVGNETGELILLDGMCEFESVFKNSPSNILNASWYIRCITNYSKGFIVGGDFCLIFVYRLNEESKQWDVCHQIQAKQLNDYKDFFVNSLAVSPNLEEKISCILSNNMIFGAKLKPDIEIDQQELRESLLEPITLSFHYKMINSMDIAIRKPLIATAGNDKTIKIWNYEEKTLETMTNCHDEPFAISIHPNGFNLVVGFADKILLMNVIPNNQITQYHSFAFKGCREIKYSNGGQFFAVVNGTFPNNQTIHIFNTYTGENPITLKGHTARVRCIYWSKDDTVLVSGGQDGMVCAWTFGFNAELNKVSSYAKSISFTSVALTNDNKMIFAAGHSTQQGSTERFLKEVALDGTSDDRKDMGIAISQIAFPTSNKLLFAGICDETKSAGAIRCYKFPLSGHCSEYQAHDDRGIEKMRVTYDDQYLITAGRDGCLMIFEIKDKEARGMKIKEGFSKPSDEILITRVELDAIKEMTDQFTQNLQDQQQSQNTTAKEDDLIKQLKEKLESNKENHVRDYNSLLESKQDREKKYEDELKLMRENFEIEIQELDNTNQKLIMHEVQKYEEAKKNQGIRNTKYEKEMKTLENTHMRNIKQLEDENNSLLEFERLQREQLTAEKEDRRKEYEENLKQINNETEEEIQNLYAKHSQEVNSINDTGLKAKSEISLNKKRIAALINDANDVEGQKRELDDSKLQYKQQNLKLKSDIDEIKRIIQDRDKTIGDKENKISELKKRSQELERFKFVLDHKIKELKRDIVPREAAIAKMKEQTNEMDQKLKKFNELNNQLGEFVNNLDSIQSTLNEEIKKKRSHISYQNVRIKQFKDDVYKAVQYIQNYGELKNQSTNLFNIYSTKDLKPPEIDPDIESEYKSQKKYLQKSVGMLKKNLEKDNEIHKQDNLRIMKENVDLIREINKLRKNIKDIKGGPKLEEEKKNNNNEKMESRFESENVKENEENLSGLNDDTIENRKIYELQTKKMEELKEKINMIERETQSLQK